MGELPCLSPLSVSPYRQRDRPIGLYVVEDPQPQRVPVLGLPAQNTFSHKYSDWGKALPSS